jgi:hypothetical protein
MNEAFIVFLNCIEACTFENYATQNAIRGPSQLITGPICFCNAFYRNCVHGCIQIHADLDHISPSAVCIALKLSDTETNISLN